MVNLYNGKHSYCRKYNVFNPIDEEINLEIRLYFGYNKSVNPTIKIHGKLAGGPLIVALEVLF